MSDYLPVSAEEFKQTGYARAKEAIDSYPVSGWPSTFVLYNQLNPHEIQQAYIKYYNDNDGKNKRVPKYTYKKLPLVGTYLYTKNSTETTPILTPTDFKDVFMFVASNKGDAKFAPVQRIRNDRYANFTESLDTFIQSTESLKIMKKRTASEIVAGAASNMVLKAKSSVSAVAGSPQVQMTMAQAQKTSDDTINAIKNAGGGLGGMLFKAFTK